MDNDKETGYDVYEPPEGSDHGHCVCLLVGLADLLAQTLSPNTPKFLHIDIVALCWQFVK